MRKPTLLLALAIVCGGELAAQERDDVPKAEFDVPPSLAPVAPRMPLPPAFPPPADPRTIHFDPYFFPTHYNFRPLPYGYPPSTSGFFYGAYASPYYYQYYGPGLYYGY